MLERFKHYIETNNLLTKDDKILVALSGGVDSMVLASLLMKAQFHVAFAHCNFHLRGEESDADETFVRDFAEKNNVVCHVKHFDTTDFANDNHISIEMAARELRYAWFNELAEKDHFTKIAVAHHQNDQIETFFINLFRGSGLQGLKSIANRNGRVVRPLLCFSRDEIKSYALNNGISWRDDRTNEETIFLRNKIRHQLMPQIYDITEGNLNSVLRSISFLASENALYRSLLDEKIKAIEHIDGRLHSIVKSYFEDEIGLQLLFEWIRCFGFSFEQATEIRRSLFSTECKRFFAEKYILTIQRENIEIFPSTEDVVREIHVEEVKRDESFVICRDASQMLQLDADKVVLPLTFRRWRQGDRFRPLGMKGSKLLSDFFHELSFTEYQKREAIVVEDASSRIVGVMGYRISDFVKIEANTRRILLLK